MLPSSMSPSSMLPSSMLPSSMSPSSMLRLSRNSHQISMPNTNSECEAFPACAFTFMPKKRPVLPGILYFMPMRS